VKGIQNITSLKFESDAWFSDFLGGKDFFVAFVVTLMNSLFSNGNMITYR
jgi:hypothetical protein